MKLKTFCTKTYLIFCTVLLTIFACDSPDFQSIQDQTPDTYESSTDTAIDGQSTNSHIPTDTDTFPDAGFDTSSPQPDTSQPDTTPPQPTVTITSAPETLTNQKNATFDFECNQNNCIFECSMNGPFTDCTSPITYNNLNDNTYTFITRAYIPPADTSPNVKHTWTVDTTPPEIINLTGPPPHTNLKTAKISFECNKTDCTFECALNEDDFEPCTAPKHYKNLPDGQHKVAVRPRDPAQNTGEPTITTWTVDTVPPTVTILTGPKDNTYFSTATFTFECNKPDCTFACSIDNAATFQNCTSPATFENFERKPQQFTVRATDRAQNSALSKPYKWTVTWPKWVQVAVGGKHACGRIDDGTIWCWGDTLGHPTIDSSDVPIQVESASDWQYIAAGAATTCGIRNGRLYCWGNVTGGDSEPNSVLKRYNGTNWTSMSLGNGQHYCGIRTTNQLWCWGNNSYGQLGIGSTGQKNEPVQVPNPNGWSMVSVGTFHTCGSDLNSDGFCWGSNNHGQLPAADPSTEKVSYPRYVSSLNISGPVWAIGNHTFTERLFSAPPSPQAYGENSNGQLGLGHYTSPINDAPTVNPQWLTNLTGSNPFSCGRLDTKIYCTGQNNAGQLGRGYTSHDENTFRTIDAPGVEFTQIDASGSFLVALSSSACALDTNHNIWCWGDIANPPTPTMIPWPY